jgi:ankyrin repeat protein
VTQQDEGPEPDPAVLDLAERCFEMARSGDPRLAAYVDAGLPVNLTDHAGNTLLMLAAYHGNAATVADLVVRGAEPDRVNDRGQSPLAGAVFKGDADVVRALLAAGADPGAGTPSAIEAARFFEQEELYRLLTADRPASDG